MEGKFSSGIARAVGITVGLGIAAVLLATLADWGTDKLTILLILWVTLQGVNLWASVDKESRWSEVGKGLFISGVFAVTLWTVDRLQRDFESRQTEKQQAFDRRQSLRLTIGLRRDLPGIDLAGENLSEFQLGGKDLSGADLSGANLTLANLRATDLSGADLTNAVLVDADLVDANLDDATLSGANLSDVDMTQATAAHANFSGATLHRTNLEGVDMAGSCLAGAHLNDAVFPGADLTSAVLTDADLTGTAFETDLRPATLAGAGFAGASTSDDSIWPSGVPPADRIEPEAAKIAVPELEVPSRAQTDRVVSVSDGDTVELERLGAARLIGVDAPDLVDTGGEASRAYAEERLDGATVKVTTGLTGIDTFDRKLVYVWLPGGDSFNADLLATGHAIVGPTDPFATDAFARAEQKAKQLGIGYWHGCPAS